METFEASTDSWNTAYKTEHKPCPMISLGFPIKEASLPPWYSIKTLYMKRFVYNAKEIYSHLDEQIPPRGSSRRYWWWWFICLIEEKLLEVAQWNMYIFTNKPLHSFGSLEGWV